MTDHSATRRPHSHDHSGHGHDHSPVHGGHEHEAQGGHEHPAQGGHEHKDRAGWARLRHRLAHLAVPHSHEAAGKIDPAMEASAEGMRTLRISLAVLGLTTVLQALVVALSGSVALLGDTIHNGADALTAVPLGIAFVLGRRAATRRFTYGFGRAEDLAGIVILVVIAASSALAAYTAVGRLLDPRPITHLPVVAAAAVIGFTGNELIARYRIRTGRKIGSAALVADGVHARTDGFTSLAVLLGAGGAALGWRLADPIVGLLITVAILLVLKDAAGEVFRRLMDAVDPALVDAVKCTLQQVPGVVDAGEPRLRWTGHQLRAEASVVIDGALDLRSAHQVTVDAEHALLHAVPRLATATIHPDPTCAGREDPHAVLAHHGPG